MYSPDFSVLKKEIYSSNDFHNKKTLYLLKSAGRESDYLTK
ncbi:hypothetical protein D356_00406 [Enterococcus faecium SD2A-2]|jgi:hypothetical protein|uniref:Uncharacterized protein n=1 Tax=Enterococcus faecium SD2A-2 TaxID=1244154 RepID=A0AB73ACZ5_ENTFC|nr:hypothetical protein D356_00406 [Enterococcus faecium SD2A-2]KXA10450.1 hypothetical protein HMPREF3199_00797 [Enterococcus faecium]MBL4989424.1 hypothetical protein [Enterococcus lactis]MBL4992578.1 hypothetical protein [Enterococcus lactis]